MPKKKEMTNRERLDLLHELENEKNVFIEDRRYYERKVRKYECKVDKVMDKILKLERMKCTE